MRDVRRRGCRAKIPIKGIESGEPPLLCKALTNDAEQKSQ